MIPQNINIRELCNPKKYLPCDQQPVIQAIIRPADCESYNKTQHS